MSNALRFRLAVILTATVVACHGGRSDRLIADGDGRLENGDATGALQLYEEAARVAPDNELARYSIAAALYALDRYEQALGAIDRVIEQDDAEPEYHYLRGNVLVRLERFDDALGAYETAVERDSGFAKAYYAIGITHYNRRDYPAAVDWLQHYVRIAPRDERERAQSLIDFLSE